MKDFVVKITHTDDKFSLRVGDAEIKNVTGYMISANTQSRLVSLSIETAIKLDDAISDERIEQYENNFRCRSRRE